MRFFLIALTVIAIFGALFSGGCSLVALFTASGRYSGPVVNIASGVGLAAAAVLGMKGVLIGAVIGQWWASETNPAGDP